MKRIAAVSCLPALAIGLWLSIRGIGFIPVINSSPVPGVALHKISALPDFVVRRNSDGRCEGDINRRLTAERETELLASIAKCQGLPTGGGR